MKILLIRPPMTLLRNEIKSVVFPLGLAYIAARLEKEGHQIEVLDAVVLGQDSQIEREGMLHFGLDWSEISKRIAFSNPKVIGISCMFSSQSNNAYKIAELAKKWNPKIPVIFGGAHPSSVPEEVLSRPEVDYIILGEGEESIVQLVNCISNNNFDVLAEVEGVGMKLGNSLKINPKINFIAGIDQIPFPARHLFPMELYFKSEFGHGSDLISPPLSSMITSRGCPYHCVYCSVHTVWGRNYRPRSPKNVADEIEVLVKEYGVKEIHFEDDNLTLKKERMIDICREIISRRLKFRWTTPNGVALWTLDAEVLGWMKKAGCYKLCFGIESGDPETQKFIRKHIPLDKCKEVVKEANKLGIWTHGFFIIGFPFEEMKSINNTLSYAIESDLDFASFFLATPYPKTDLYTIMQENGLVGHLTWESLRVSAGSINTKHFTAEELQEIQKKMFKKFVLHRALSMLNPIKLSYRLKRLKKIEDWRFVARFGKRFLQITK